MVPPSISEACASVVSPSCVSDCLCEPSEIEAEPLPTDKPIPKPDDFLIVSLSLYSVPGKTLMS